MRLRLRPAGDNRGETAKKVDFSTFNVAEAIEVMKRTVWMKSSWLIGEFSSTRHDVCVNEKRHKSEAVFTTRNGSRKMEARKKEMIESRT